MSTLVWAGSILALLTYFPLWKQIRSGDSHQNLLTWALWGVLDLIVAATLTVQKGNFFLPIIYAAGSTITAYFIWKIGKRDKWTPYHTFVVLLTAASMIVWYLSGSKIATIASTTAMLIAGLPQLGDAWKKPHKMPLLPYASYSVANLLSTIGGKSWAIEERFYPASATIFCFLIVVFTLRKFLSSSTRITDKSSSTGWTELR